MASKKNKQKDPAAVELGHKGGEKGGPARARKLSRERREEIAREGARVRWGEQAPPKGRKK